MDRAMIMEHLNQAELARQKEIVAKIGNEGHDLKSAKPVA
jgi:hypothetical protein